MSPVLDRRLAPLVALALSAACAGQEAYVLEPLRAERFVVAQGAYFPRLLILPGGELLAAFKYGAAHIGKSGKAGVARSDDGGRTWSAPETVFDIPDADDGIDASGMLHDGTLLLGAVSYTWRGEKYSTDGWKADTYILRSRDRGRSWSKPAKVNVSPFTWAYPFGRILELPDGVLLLSGYGGYLPRAEEDTAEGTKRLAAEGQRPAKPEPRRGDFCFVVRSRDGGSTWGDLSIIARRYNEVTLLPLKTGELLAVMRSQEEGQHLAATISSDGGHRWSQPARITGDSEHPGDLLRLSSGPILLTYGRRHKPFGVEAMISRDDGTTWDRDQRVMLAWDGDHGDLGYPVTVERPDGRLVTIYYIVYGERDTSGDKGIAPRGAFTKVIIWDPPANWRASQR